MTGSLSRTIQVNGKEIKTDTEGYLKNLNDWPEEFARARAQEEGLALTEEHWQVIRFLRDLFPIGGPQKQGNRLAGLLRTKGEH